MYLCIEMHLNTGLQALFNSLVLQTTFIKLTISLYNYLLNSKALIKMTILL